MSFSKKLKQFDAYPKTLEDFRVRTFSGGTISLVAGIFIVFLFVSEFAYYLTTEVHPELSVDTSRGEQLRINVDVIFPRLPCAFLSVDAMDASGQTQLDLEHNLFKKRLDRNGNPVAATPLKEDSLGKPKQEMVKKDEIQACGSCYGAEQYDGQCCNTCDEVREAYRVKGWSFTSPENIEQCVKEGLGQSIEEVKGEGCHVYGFLLVNKVAGNFHFAPGQTFKNEFAHVHDASMYGDSFDLSHIINSISFGEEFPGAVNPLDGVRKEANLEGEGISTLYQYFVKVVPTVYENLSGTSIKTNQFSVTEHYRALPPVDHGKQGHAHTTPGVYFQYDLSPIMVRFSERRKSLSHFLTGVCAIVGGVFTVAGIVDSLVYHSLRTFQAKVELGKHT